MYRQALAIGIIGIAYLELRKRNFARYSLLGLLGFSIHYTALIFLLFPFLLFFSNSIKKRSLHFLYFLFMIVLFELPVVKLLVSIVPNFCYPVTILKSYVLYMDLGSVHITHSHIVSMFIMILTNHFFESLKKTKFFDINLIQKKFNKNNLFNNIYIF